MPVATVPRPFIKCVGGKGRLLAELRRRLPRRIVRYFEPFVGGGALFWELRREALIEQAVLGDSDERTVRAYRGVRDDVEEVIRLLRFHVERHSPEHFALLRPVTAFPTDAACAAWRIYMSRAAFNGLYRVSATGRFNASWGKHSRIAVDEQNLRACARALRDVEPMCGDFSLVTAVSGIGPGDFVYLDPPYVPTTRTANFRGYTAAGFTEADQRRLADRARELKEAGGSVMLTNSDAPFVRELYPEPFWRVDRVEVRSDAVSCRGDRRQQIGELIIT